MGHAQQLRDLLAPLGVYRWEGTFQWGEPQSQGAALDQVAEELADTQQEMHLATAQGEGLDRILSLLGRERGEASVEDLRATAAALLRIGGGSFTLAAMNDTLRGCGLPARVEETGDPLKLKVLVLPGLYLAGEVLDVAGECGGYNLHWAWCSGILAGRRAVGEAEL